MTKKKVKAFFCAALMALTLSATACGGSSSKDLETYLKEDAAVMQEMEDQMADMENETMDMAIDVKGNEIYFVGTFKESAESLGLDTTALNDYLDQVGVVFSPMAGSLDEEVGLDKGTISVGIRYCDSDGSVLVEKSFKAE